MTVKKVGTYCLFRTATAYILLLTRKKKKNIQVLRLVEDSFAVAAVLDEKQKITSYVPVSQPVGKRCTQNVAPDRTPMH